MLCVGFLSCSLCRLKNEKILGIHKKCHQGELFACPHCDKLSSTRNNLRMHMKRHSDARPHTCPLCAHGFKTPRDLKVNLMLMNPMHHDIIMKVTNDMPLYRLIYYSKSALHVSGDVFAHHQEHLTVFTVSGSIHYSPK